MKDNMKKMYENHVPDKEEIRMRVLDLAEKAQVRPKRKSMLALCLSMALLISTAVVMVSCEAKEYNDAVAFFEKNNLSTEGLSRSDIKKVYRAIKTERFDENEVIGAIGTQVGGYEINTNLSGLNGSNWANHLFGMDENGFYVVENIKTDSLSSLYKMKAAYDDEGIFLTAFLRKYDGETLLWEKELDFHTQGCVEYEDKVIVYGDRLVRNELTSNPGLTVPGIAVLDKEGNVLWQKLFYDATVATSNGSAEDAYACDVVVKEDEIVLFIFSDLKYLCMATLSHEGEQLSFHTTESGNYGILGAAALGDDYLVRIGKTDEEYLLKVSDSGEILDKLSYSSEDVRYVITDMKSYGGKVYLSAYAVPKSNGVGYGRGEIQPILDKIYENDFDWNKITEPSSLITEYTRENYTAVLLVCDNDSVAPQEFYEVKGAMGSRLFVNDDGKLVWCVKHITNAAYSPATNAFSLVGKYYIYQYTFEKNGIFSGQKMTGETGYFRK